MTAATATPTDFLLARFAEDEAAVRMIEGSAHPRPWELRTDGNELCIDPARVLAECEAKRRIVALHTEGMDEDSGGNRFGTGCNECGGDGFGEVVAWPCPTLRALAAVYADHPEFRPEWRP